ncbi:MAG: DUF2378 family protein [Myxococcota bacterium]
MAGVSRPGFVAPDFNAPLDVDERLARLPAEARVKGMFIHRLVEMAQKKQLKHPRDGERFIAFKDYPVPLYLQALVDTARLLHPNVPPRRALYELGLGVYPALLDSMIGRVVFGALGRDLNGVLRITSKAYEIASNYGKCTVVEQTPRSVLLHLKDVWAFPDCHHVGVVEGAISVHGPKATTAIRVISISEVQLFAVWD